MKKNKFRALARNTVTNELYFVYIDIGERFIGSEKVLTEWEQYIGLRDRNGKEIYEGDIVLWEGHLSVCKWIEEEAMFILEDVMDNKSIGDNYYSEKSAEIIGNIHENSINDYWSWSKDDS